MDVPPEMARLLDPDRGSIPIRKHRSIGTRPNRAISLAAALAARLLSKVLHLDFAEFPHHSSLADPTGVGKVVGESAERPFWIRNHDPGVQRVVQAVGLGHFESLEDGVAEIHDRGPFMIALVGEIQRPLHVDCRIVTMHRAVRLVRSVGQDRSQESAQKFSELVHHDLGATTTR